MAYRFTTDAHEAQDLTQEIFISLFKSLYSFKGRSALGTWIYRISLNRCLDWKRKQQRRRPFIFNQVSQEAAQDVINKTSKPLSGPEDDYLRIEESKELHLAIKSLPEKYQTVIILYHFQQLSYQNISQILGVPTRTVETRLYRGKRMLGNKLSGQSGNGVRSYDAVRT
jgi:RNA polymerase sigma-70 factor (ECF subfamily)